MIMTVFKIVMVTVAVMLANGDIDGDGHCKYDSSDDLDDHLSIVSCSLLYPQLPCSLHHMSQIAVDYAHHESHLTHIIGQNTGERRMSDNHAICIL
jgi:hypothetical protein